MYSQNRNRTVVIGGGLAGLSAAWNAARAGQSVVVLERSPYLGGRCASFYDLPSMRWLDNCPHVFLDCCDGVREFFAQTGLIEFWKPEREFYFYPQRRHVLILPSVRTSIPRYIRHIIPDSCKGRQLFTVSHDGDRLHLFLNGRRIKEPSLYPGTAGNGLPDGLFIGAYGVHGRKVQQFFHGTIHSVKITYGSAAEGEFL